MHFSSSSSTESFSFTAFFLLLMFDSLEPDVRVRSRSLFRRSSDCWISWTGPFLTGRSRVWMLVWRVTGPQMTVSWGELASDWLSQLEVERSLQDVPLSPSLSPLPFLQQQSQCEDDHLEGSPARKHRTQGVNGRSVARTHTCMRTLSLEAEGWHAGWNATGEPRSREHCWEAVIKACCVRGDLV